MAISHAQVSVGTAAALLSTIAAGRDGQTILIQNPSGGTSVYLGAANVTSSLYGYILVGGTDFAIDLQGGEGIYAVTASGTQTLNILRQGV